MALYNYIDRSWHTQYSGHATYSPTKLYIQYIDQNMKMHFYKDKVVYNYKMQREVLFDLQTRLFETVVKSI